jgi:excisionase family DNA binding protein
MENYLTIPEVARLAGVSRVAVLYAVREGRIPGAVRLGRIWAIPRKSAEAYEPRPYAFGSSGSRRRDESEAEQKRRISRERAKVRREIAKKSKSPKSR